MFPGRDLTDASLRGGWAVTTLNMMIRKVCGLGAPVELVGLKGASATLIDRLATHDKSGALEQAGH